MPAKIQSNVILPAQHMEKIVLVSELGRIEHLYIPMGEVENRQAQLDQALAEMDARDQAVKDYAAKHGVAIHGQKEAEAV